MVWSMSFDTTADHAPITHRNEGITPKTLNRGCCRKGELTTEDTVVTEKTVHSVWKRSSAFRLCDPCVLCGAVFVGELDRPDFGTILVDAHARPRVTRTGRWRRNARARSHTLRQPDHTSASRNRQKDHRRHNLVPGKVVTTVTTSCNEFRRCGR